MWFFTEMSEGSPINSLIQPVLGRLVKRAVAAMEEYQSKKSLLPRLTSENVVTEEDEEALSRALGGTTRLVSRKQGSNPGSRSGTSETESLPPSSPRETESPSLNRMDSSPSPQYPATSPAATLVPPFSHTGSPRTEWHNSWGLPESQYTYPMYPTNTANTQWPTATPGGWYNPQPTQFHDPTSLPPQHQHTNLHHQQPPYLTVDVTMGNAFPSFGQTSSALSGAMSPYDYPQQQQQQQALPQNPAHAQSWQNLFNEMGANYS